MSESNSEERVSVIFTQKDLDDCIDDLGTCLAFGDHGGPELTNDAVFALTGYAAKVVRRNVTDAQRWLRVCEAILAAPLSPSHEAFDLRGEGKYPVWLGKTNSNEWCLWTEDSFHKVFVRNPNDPNPDTNWVWNSPIGAYQEAVRLRFIRRD